jgi:ABC-type tungstate transport system substrate-binding protein
MSVIHDTQRPESVTQKKSNSICYNVARESAAIYKCIIVHVRSENNLPIFALIISLDGCSMTFLIDDFVIFLLAEEVHGSLGVSLFSIGWTTKYIIIWRSFVNLPVIITLQQKTQCDSERNKEKRTLALGVGMRTHGRCYRMELRE